MFSSGLPWYRVILPITVLPAVTFLAVIGYSLLTEVDGNPKALTKQVERAPEPEAD